MTFSEFRTSFALMWCLLIIARFTKFVQMQRRGSHEMSGRWRAGTVGMITGAAD